MTRAPLEPDLAALIEPHTGPILQAARNPRGFTSDYTGIIQAAAGPVFVKAVRDPGRLVSSLEREASINPRRSAHLPRAALAGPRPRLARPRLPARTR